MTRRGERKPRAEVARNMAAIRSTENRSEAALRSALFRMGLRFHKYSASLPGKPDIIFRAARLAVFVDGDYWHARGLREHGLAWLKGRYRRATWRYWKTKFLRRIERDDQVTGELRSMGWKVIRAWESDLNRDPGRVAKRIGSLVRSRTRPRLKRT